MTMTEWAEQEVKIACDRELKTAKEEEDEMFAQYSVNCYRSALKAYKALMSDEHSGLSFSITKNILTRLLNELPLTAITEDDFGDYEPGQNMCQCRRLSSLFKVKDESGNEFYLDNNRTISIDVDTGRSFRGGVADSLINKMYPIELPYFPKKDKYQIYTKFFTADPEQFEQAETRAILYVITPEGKRVDINSYGKEAPDRPSGWQTISEDEYNKRLASKINWKYVD